MTKFRSKLGPFEDEIRSLKVPGLSIREIAAEMRTRHALEVSHNAVASFMRTHRMTRRNFFDGIPETRRGELLQALKAIWTHDSTAIEGNTLTLGDTIFVLQYGLTVKGKSLKDHDDVIAHARGVDAVMRLARLLVNLPVLYAGHVPIVEPKEGRADYIRALWAYQRAVGTVSLAAPALLPEPERLDALKTLLRS